MNGRLVFVAAGLTALLATVIPVSTLTGTALAGEPKISSEDLTMIRIEVKMEIAAPPAKVWTHLTTGQNLVTWCPVWTSSRNAAITLTKVGDVLDFTDSYGNGGKSVVTYLEKGKELRVVHEPADGSYVCQAKILLEGAGAGSRLTYVEQYSDESGPSDRKATLAKTEAEMIATLNSLKEGVE
jgi:uncharacterized protein YndB with AHSA1/START domain